MTLDSRNLAVSILCLAAALALALAYAKLAAKRETPVAELERAAQPLTAEDRATAEKLLDLRFQLKSVLTASEWTKVLPPPATPAGTAKKSARAAPRVVSPV